ncbi:hypothetical protein GJ496_004884 [Pomphorhynchus laevis]|nr:hypothetical protein GJ496_004884 [Pomphorhynchus laevis]
MKSKTSDSAYDKTAKASGSDTEEVATSAQDSTTGIVSKRITKPTVEKTISKEKYFGGIEGGATKTNMVIIDCKRNVIAEGEVGPSNPWLVGFDESAKLLLQLIDDTKSRAISDNPIVLEAVGMSLSGAGQAQSRTQLSEALKKKGANLDQTFIEEDILAPVFALSNKGGVNMICGTGSNCVVYNDDSTSKRVGGWGHLLGDEAGAYFIAQRAIKMLFDHFDNYHPLKFNVEKVKTALFKYMKITTMDAMLEHFYKNFSKDFIAGFSKELSKLANEGDEFAKDVFYQAGEEIGRHILAIQPSIKVSTLEKSRILTVICTGSVFNSWKHLKPGFQAILNNSIKLKKSARYRFTKMISKDLLKYSDNLVLNENVKEINLLKLKIPAAIGAAVWAASKMKVPIADPKRSEISESVDKLYFES